VKLLFILCAAAIAVIILYQRYERDGLAEARRTLPTRLAPGIAPRAAGLRADLQQEAVLELWMRDDKAWQLFSLSDLPLLGSARPSSRKATAGAGSFYQWRAAIESNSRHHLSFDLGYPNAYDQAHGRPVLSHGAWRCSSIGCYAMTDPAVDDIYGLVSAALRNGRQASSPCLPVPDDDGNMAKTRSHAGLILARSQDRI